MKNHDGKMYFQLSGIRSDENNESFKVIFKNLNIKFDDGKNYCPESTHLVVDQLNTTEKILCFIAAGKHILRQSYIKDSLQQGLWLNERGYHISNKYKDSKLANASLKWKEKIEKDRVYPFQNWKVISFINEKSRLTALNNIIQAGKGEIYNISSGEKNFNSTSLQKTIHNCTCVVYSESQSETAQQFSSLYSKVCYPFQAIPDYLIQSCCFLYRYYKGDYSKTPILSTNYYASIPQSVNSHLNGNDIENIQLESKPEKELLFLNGYSVYSSKVKPQGEYEKVNSSFSQNFYTWWMNASYIEALDLLKSLNANELPEIDHLQKLLEFLPNRYSMTAQNLVPNVKQTHDHIYHTIHDYFTELFCNYPPIDKKSKRYYKKIFQNYSNHLYCDFKDANEVKTIVDTLYLLSIHDYLFFMLNLLEKMAVHRKNYEMKYFYKILQIISLLNKYMKKPDNTASMHEKIVNIEYLIEKYIKNDFES